jgi:hypothetical protein
VARSADVVWVEVPYDNAQPFSLLPQEQQERWLCADAAAAMAAALAQRSYLRLTLLGHAMGTVAVAHLLDLDPSVLVSEAIWLSPVVRHCRVREQLKRPDGRSLVIVGTADDEYDRGFIHALSRSAAQVLIVPDADRYMDVPNDLARSGQALDRIIEVTRRFLWQPADEKEAPPNGG